MLPGKKYGPDEFAAIAWKRKWFLLLPTVIVAGVTAVATSFLPDRYRSEAQVLIVEQRVPRSYVQPTVTAGLDERLQAIRQQVMSRTRLEGMIQEFDPW